MDEGKLISYFSKSIGKFKSDCKHAQKLLEEEKKTPGSNLDSLILELKALESFLMTFRERHLLEYQLLVTEQTTLEMDLEPFQDPKYWELILAKAKHSVKDSVKHTSKKISNDNNPVQEFHDFVFRFGAYGVGWSGEDHLQFLEKRAKTSNLSNVKVVGKSETEILDHHEWYQKYCLLKSKRDEALNIWKAKKLEKEATKKHKLVQVISSDNFDTCAPKKSTTIDISHPKTSNDKEDVKMRISKFREQKKLLALKDAEEKRLEDLEKRQKFNQHQEKLKKIIAESRIEKENEYLIDEIDGESMELERKERQRQIQRKLKERQEKDIMEAKDKFSKILLKKAPINIPAQMKSAVKVDSDPERLLRPTKAFLERISKSNGDSEAWSSILDIESVQKRGIPGWRKMV